MLNRFNDKVILTVVRIQNLEHNLIQIISKKLSIMVKIKVFQEMLEE
jgi:hypothetical protein